MNKEVVCVCVCAGVCTHTHTHTQRILLRNKNRRKSTFVTPQMDLQGFMLIEVGQKKTNTV